MENDKRADELQLALDKAQSGDNDALTELLLAYLPLIRSQAGVLAGMDRHLKEDLAQEGLLALCRATALFQPRRGPFGAFLKVCVRNAMISHLRRRPIEEIVDEEWLEREVEPGPGLDEIVEARERLRQAARFLSDTELLAMDAFLETGGIGRAARALGWPRKKVDNALTRARAKLRVIAPGDD